MAFDKLKQLGDLKKLRDQAMQMQKQLSQEKVTIEHQGVKVVMTGDQKVEALEIDEVAYPRIIEAVNKAIKKSQMMAAKKLAQISGGNQ